MVLLSADGQLLHSATSENSRNHTAEINLMIEAMQRETGLSIRQLSAVSVIGGPGSYTGLRIGMATAKGICFATDKPLLMPNKLELLVRAAMDREPGFDYYAAVLPARTQEYFACIYDRNENPLLAPAHLFQTDVVARFTSLNKKVLLLGENDFLADLTENADYNFRQETEIDPEYYCRYSFESYNCNGFVNLASSEPFYLKQVYTHKPQ